MCCNGRGRRSPRSPRSVFSRLNVTPGKYLLATVHRSENTDDPQRLTQIVDAFNAIHEPIIFPVHPRARKVMKDSGRRFGPHVQLIDPVGYLDMVALAGSARLVSPIPAVYRRKPTGFALSCLDHAAEDRMGRDR